MTARHTTFTFFLLTLALTAGTGLLLSRMGSRRGAGIEQWGLGGRQFGTLITWFLVGGDFYTAYTILAVPALVFGTGAAGFFALPYTILVYPFVFVVMPRLWSVCRKHNLVTSADFVQLRFGSSWLASAVAVTGVIAVVPYISLQFAGIESILQAIGLGGSSGLSQALPLLIAFGAVSLFTVVAGLRGPALIAFSKDTMIYVVVIAAVLLLPSMFGGYKLIFHRAAVHFAQQPGANLVLQPKEYSGYVTLALGSALAAFLYPHTITSVLASSGANVIRKNAFLLPAYTFLLGLIALLGLVGVGAGLKLESPKQVIPALFTLAFPAWFLGFAFAAIVVAALVPASIMSIAAGNLLAKNLFGHLAREHARTQASVAKVSSVIINGAATAMVLLLPMQYAINLQLFGGVIVLQTLPAIVFGLWPHRLHAHALLLGWVAGIVSSVVMLGQLRLQSSLYPLHLGGHTYSMYVGILALVANLLVLLVVSLVLGLLGREPAAERIPAADYLS